MTRFASTRLWFVSPWKWAAMAGTVVAAIASGSAAALPAPAFAMLMAAGLGAVLALAHPRLALMLFFAMFIMLTDSAGQGAVDFFAIADSDTITGLPSIGTTCFLGLFVMMVVRSALLRHDAPAGSLGYLGVWLAVLILALCVGLARGNDREMLQTDFIAFLLPALCFYLCIQVIRTGEDVERMLGALLVVAALKAIILSAYFVAGRGWPYEVAGEESYRVVTMDSADLLVFITLLMVIIATGGHAFTRRIPPWFAWCAAVPMIFAVVFAYRRAQWGGLLFSCGMLVFLASRAGKRRIRVTMTVLALTGAAAVLVAAFTGSRLAGGISDRFVSSFDPAQDSNVYHALESRQVLRDLMTAPLAGLGLGARHTPLGLYKNDGVPTNIVHNTFLYVWMKTGVAGLLCVLWSAGLLARCLRGFRRRAARTHAWDLGAGLAATTGLWAAMFLTGPVPWYAHQTLLIALFAAMMTVLARSAAVPAHALAGRRSAP